MEVVTLDTNAIIDGFGDRFAVAQKIRKFQEMNAIFVISTITEVELFSFPHLTIEEALRLERLITNMYSVSVSSKVARLTADVRRVYKLKTSDAIIAATALLNGGKLMTRDKAFQKIDGLTII